jgi:osmotically-inducible protein OsmY
MTADRELQERVLSALDRESVLRPAGIGVVVKHGIVTLVGQVEALCERWAAERAIRDVPGVRAVANELILGRKRPEHDQLLAEPVARALSWTLDIPSCAIKAVVWDGFVTLTGTVDREDQRLRAERAVRAVSGVTSVFNALAVRYPPRFVAGDWFTDEQVGVPQ